uniref:Mediator of RNA polymerase II transcription subunit 31 n=1 Tax=Salix viminalis TaxID=40686 RepID=A0A6N2KZG2_SALVM
MENSASISMASPKEADNNPDTPSSPRKIYKDPDDGRQRYPHCLYFLELLQNVNFRNAMAHPGNKELAHRQQFFFWKNYRNNRLKHILPRPLPEPVTAPPAPAPPAQPVSAATLGMPAASGAVPSPMPYGMPPGSAFGKSDIRSSGSDRRKRKKEV